MAAGLPRRDAPVACASSSATCATATGSSWRMRGVDYRRPRRGAEAGAGRRIQPVRVHPAPTSSAPRTWSTPRSTSGVKRVIALSTDKAATRSTSTARPSSPRTRSSSPPTISPAPSARASPSCATATSSARAAASCRSSSKLIAEGADMLPITDARMTRFWITLEQGVDFVLVVASSAMQRRRDLRAEDPEHEASSTSRDAIAPGLRAARSSASARARSCTR